jgi:hypothetical protein
MSKFMKVYDVLLMAFTGVTIVAFVYVIANNVALHDLWIQKCKDGGGITVTAPNGYVCVNPGAIIEVD